MDKLLYRILPSAAGGWAFEHNGELSMSYMTREAAFEAVLGPVSNAIKEGAAIEVTIAAPPAGEAVIEPRKSQ
jgi:hypothetical protein